MSSKKTRIFRKIYNMEQNLSCRLREIRLEAKLTQMEFGQKLGVSQDTVSLWEKGKSLPAAEYIILICKQFDISADYLLGLKDF